MVKKSNSWIFIFFGLIVGILIGVLISNNSPEEVGSLQQVTSPLQKDQNIARNCFKCLESRGYINCIKDTKQTEAYCIEIGNPCLNVCGISDENPISTQGWWNDAYVCVVVADGWNDWWDCMRRRGWYDDQ